MANSGLPYVGVTGFTTPDEVHQLLAQLADGYQNRLEARPLMVGVLVNSRTLTGKNPEKQSPRYPTLDDVKPIFEQAQRQGDKMTLRLVHFNTKTPQSLGDELKQLAEHCGWQMEGVQLNVCWPDPDQLKDALKDFRRVVLQIGKEAYQECIYTWKSISLCLNAYKGLITDILIDPSGGRGVLVNLEHMPRTLADIKEKHPNLGIGVAGGLDKKTSKSLAPLFAEFPDLSVDAESRLRSEDDTHLDIVKTREYVKSVFDVVQKERR